MNKRKKEIESILNNFQSIKRVMASGGHSLHKNSNITMTQITVLFIVKNRGEISVSGIANELGVSKSAITQLLDTLLKDKLLLSETSEDDRRITNIKLSPKGIKHLDDARKKIYNKVSKMFELLDDSEISQLVVITNKILKYKEGATE